MRLLCINSDGWETRKRKWFGLGKIKWVETDGPVYGDEVNSIGEAKPDEFGEYWLLKEWPQDKSGFLKSCFIPMTGEKEERTEIEMIMELQTVTPDWFPKIIKKYSTNE